MENSSFCEAHYSIFGCRLILPKGRREMSRTYRMMFGDVMSVYHGGGKWGGLPYREGTPPIFGTRVLHVLTSPHGTKGTQCDACEMTFV